MCAQGLVSTRRVSPPYPRARNCRGAAVIVAECKLESAKDNSFVENLQRVLYVIVVVVSVFEQQPLDLYVNLNSLVPKFEVALIKPDLNKDEQEQVP